MDLRTPFCCGIGHKKVFAMKKLKTHYSYLILSVLCASLIILAYLFLSRKLTVFRDVGISELVVCNQSITLNANSAAKCGGVFPENVRSIFVCGYINSTNPNINGISILVFKDHTEEPIYVSPTKLKLNKGDFCHEIIIATENRVGLYNVSFYYFRNVIASVVFEIR